MYGINCHQEDSQLAREIEDADEDAADAAAKRRLTDGERARYRASGMRAALWLNLNDRWDYGNEGESDDEEFV